MKIQIEPKKQYLYVHLTGIFELNAAKECSIQFLDAADDFDLFVILVDALSLEGELSTMERFHYAEFMARKSREHKVTQKFDNLRIAYVAKLPIVDPQKFGETVATNRGMLVKATTDFKEAYEWLGVEQ